METADIVVLEWKSSPSDYFEDLIHYPILSANLQSVLKKRAVYLVLFAGQHQS
jgi:hypothetical protein